MDRESGRLTEPPGLTVSDVRLIASWANRQKLHSSAPKATNRQSRALSDISERWYKRVLVSLGPLPSLRCRRDMYAS